MPVTFSLYRNIESNVEIVRGAFSESWKLKAYSKWEHSWLLLKEKNNSELLEQFNLPCSQFFNFSFRLLWIQKSQPKEMQQTPSNPGNPLRPRVEMLQTTCPETCHYSSHLIVGEKNSLTRLVLFHQVETCLVKTAFSLETIAKAINSKGWASQMLQAIVIESKIGLT